jgi:hypothetical protein
MVSSSCLRVIDIFALTGEFHPDYHRRLGEGRAMGMAVSR